MRFCYLVADMCGCERACYTPTHAAFSDVFTFIPTQTCHSTGWLREETLNTSMPDTYQHNTHASHTHTLVQHRVKTELAVGFLSLSLNSRPLNVVWILRPRNPGHILYNPSSKTQCSFDGILPKGLSITNEEQKQMRQSFFSNKKHPCWKLSDSIPHMLREGHCAHRSLVPERFLKQGQG